MSGITYHVSHVSCQLSHVNNANSHSHGPSHCQLPEYAEQDVAADLDLDHPIMSCKDTQICTAIFDHFEP